MKQDSTRQPISKQHSMRKNNTGPCEIKPYLIFGHYRPPPPPPYRVDKLGLGASLLDQTDELVQCDAGPFLQLYDTHHPSYQQELYSLEQYWLH